ncbi:hypothetical protein EMIT019CA3_20506 [Bacillus pseudomycoides]|nr:hypothetical protein DJ94_4957 [Bacillus pseudomycoides]
MKKAYFSKRIYKIDLPHEMVDALTETIETFNQVNALRFKRSSEKNVGTVRGIQTVFIWFSSGTIN